MRPSNARFWLLLIAAVVVVSIVVGGSGSEGPPLDPRSVSPDGARGVVEVLERLGAKVDIDSATPGFEATTALLLQDRLSAEDRQAVGRWVDDGGVLVVADVGSSFAARLAGGATTSDTLAREVCTIGALDGANALALQGRLLRSDGAESCFGNGTEALVVARAQGDGVIVTVGSTELFTNAELDEADAAVVAVSLLAPNRGGAHVSFIGPSLVEFGEESLNDLIPTRVTNAIWQLLAAFLLYALYRSRRLGGVVAEPVPVRIEGSELVLKAGVLSERAKDPTSAAAVLRDDFVARARRALSVPPSEDLGELTSRVAAYTGIDFDTVSATLSSPVATEADLLQVSQNLSSLDQGLDRDRGTAKSGSST